MTFIIRFDCESRVERGGDQGTVLGVCVRERENGKSRLEWAREYACLSHPIHQF